MLLQKCGKGWIKHGAAPKIEEGGIRDSNAPDGSENQLKPRHPMPQQREKGRQSLKEYHQSNYPAKTLLFTYSTADTKAKTKGRR